MLQSEHRKAMDQRAKEESRRMNVIKRQIRARQSIGDDWDGTTDRGAKVEWPLAKALVTDKNTGLLKVATELRRVCDLAESQPMLGELSGPTGELTVMHRYVETSDGKLISKGEVVVKSSPKVEYVATKSNSLDTSMKQKAAPVQQAWSGDRAVNAAIDARSLVSDMSRRLGDLFFYARLAAQGATMKDVGAAAGVSNRTGAQAAGKALVYNALVLIRDMYGERMAATR